MPFCVSSGFSVCPLTLFTYVFVPLCSPRYLTCMWAELSGENFHSPLTWVFAPSLHRSIAPLLKVIPDSSAQRPLSTHLKFHSALVKWLYILSDLKEGAIPYVAPIWPVCLLFEIFYKLHLSMNDLWCRLTLEGTCESVWTCALFFFIWFELCFSVALCLSCFITTLFLVLDSILIVCFLMFLYSALFK